MKYLSILIFTLILGGTLSAQSRFGTTNGVDQSQMGTQQYFQFDENTSKYFWAVDLNIFSASQKSNFQELVFNCETLVAVSTPDANNYWYLASFKTTDKEDVKIELNKMINKAKIITTNPQDKYQ